MESKSIKLLTELNRQIQFLESEFEDEIIKTEKNIELIYLSIEKLKNIVSNYNFKTCIEEIKFFKEIKPKFTSKLIYNNNILRIETNKPIGSNQIVINYYQKEQKKIKYFFEDNLEFYKYYRTNSNYLDEKYFTRNNHDFKLNLETCYVSIDKTFSTSHDLKLAKLIANDLLSIYLENKIIQQENLKLKHTQRNLNSKLTWTGSKIALTELIYALQTEGVFNNGTASLKDIAETFEELFGIDLGQYRRNFLEIRTRREDRTRFLNSLKSNLIRRMDDSDEFY
ncbi:tetracycline regulation of excision, RteC [Cloacibacterium normanense]|uniref:Tetracycline regulation of excision, RteC n=1 Tax=Cloacibacterium normanense TaxID=237258 RepID=A0A2S7I8U9_9FLAO|nr:tetracycline regulation of excision, RteC [Cloacibacterium normanense]